MKRYRYGNPSSQSALQKARPYILLFVGWNLVGAICWRFFNSRAEKNDPDWFSRSEADRIARLTGSVTSQKQTISFMEQKESSDNGNSTDS